MDRARSRPLDRDKLFLTSRDRAVKDAHALLRPLNTLEPEALVAGLAVLFAAVCSRVQIDPEEVHRLGMKLLRPEAHHTKANDALQSLRDYAGLRIAGQDVTYS